MHFPHLCPEGNYAPTTPETVTVTCQPQHPASHNHNTLQVLTEDITILLQMLISEIADQAANSSAVLETTRLVKYSLMTAIASL
jgi:hypothetical protein